MTETELGFFVNFGILFAVGIAGIAVELFVIVLQNMKTNKLLETIYNRLKDIQDYGIN